MFFCCRYWHYLSLIFSTLTVIHLEKNEIQHSIPHTSNNNSWKFRAFLSRNDSIRYSNVFLLVREGKSSFQSSLKIFEVVIYGCDWLTQKDFLMYYLLWESGQTFLLKLYVNKIVNHFFMIVKKVVIILWTWKLCHSSFYLDSLNKICILFVYY